MKKVTKFKKSEKGFLAVYASLIMLMLFFIVAAWGPMMSQMATGNVETEKAIGAEYLAVGELSRIEGHIKNDDMTSGSAILDKISADKNSLNYYNLKVNDSDSDSDIDGFKFAIYKELNETSGNWEVTSIAKYNGTTKIARKTISSAGNTNLKSTALIATQSTVHTLYVEGEDDWKFKGFKNGNQLSDAIANYNEDRDTGVNILYEETNEGFINKLLGTTDYKTELGLGKLYWAGSIRNKQGEIDIVYYLAESSFGRNAGRGWAIAMLTSPDDLDSPTVEEFVYYRGLASKNGVREATKLKDTYDWEEVVIY